MTIKSDAEAVYIEGVFHARCRGLGINTVISPPYVHEQNNNAEKLFRDLGEMARCMMAASGFPAAAWPLAYRHANWLRNRLPVAHLDLGDPLLSHVRGTLRHVWGARFWLSRFRTCASK